MTKCRVYLLSIALLFSLRAQAATNVWFLRAGYSTTSSPALSPDGTLYFGSGDRKLYAVSTNRYVRWTFETGLEIKSSPAIADDGTIYFGSRDRAFYAVTPDGKLKWSFATDGWVDSSPAIAPDGTVYFGSWGRKFYALNPAGAKKWVFVTAGAIESSPAIAADGTIYFGSHNKKLYALKPDGTKKWDFATGGAILSSPAIDYSGNIYFSSVDGKFYVLNPDGTLRMKVQTGGITESSPVLSNDGFIRICINDTRGGIFPDGKLPPLQPVPGCPLDCTPTMGADGRAFYLDGYGGLSALDAKSYIAWGIELRMYFVNSPLLTPDGTIYAIPFFGPMAAVQVNTTLMDSPWPMFRANLRHTGVVNAPRR
jgi:outer membrane protein assembly factor BamB